MKGLNSNMKNLPKRFITHKDRKEIPNMFSVKSKIKTKAILSLLVFIFIFLGLFAYLVNEYIDTHTFKFQSPITIQSPMIVKRQVKTISPLSKKSVKSKKQALIPVVYAEDNKKEDNYEVSQIVDTIFTLESSRGKNDGCRDAGLWNGYGYSQSTFSWKCYQTQEEVTNLVSDWVKDKISKGYTTAELLCYYNTGVREEGCNYYNNFLKLTNNE